MVGSRVPKKWILHNPDPQIVSAISKSHQVSELLATVMANRDITADSAGKYLSPSLASMYDPEQLPGMPVAAARFADAIMSKETVTAFVDMDADGTVSGSILLRFGRMVGLQMRSYIPHRVKEGYGLNIEALRSIKEGGTTLVITADLGITNIKEAAFCRELGMDLVITDHHALNEDGILPDAIAVVNPHIPGSHYPFTHLCGAGVAFGLVVATRKVLRDRGYFSGRPEPRLIELLPLVALATIADLVEIKSENRMYVTHGLKKMYSILGIRALAQVSGIDITSPPSAGQVAFRLAPRINASGRMDSASFALELLTTENPSRADELASILDKFNQDRQAEEERVVKEALATLEANPELLQRKTIVLSGDYAQGVVGIAASRLLEVYHRPVIIISEKEDGTGKGSGRSISAFHLRNGLDKCSEFLSGYGGHPAAAGLSIKLCDLDSFRDSFELAAKELTEEDLRPVIKIDAELSESQISHSTIVELERLEPFGVGNPGPVFCIRKAKVRRLSPLKNKHLKLVLEVGDLCVEAIGWGMLDRQHEIQEVMDFVFSLGINEWRGQSSIQLTLKDFST